MHTSTHIRSLLRQGDRRTVGRVAEVVETVFREPELVSALVDCMFETDGGTRMRAADALEKVSRKRAEEIQPHISALLGLFVASEQQEIRWHLAVILPRLRLDAKQRRRTSWALQHCLTAESSIVRTFALQGLSDLTTQMPSLTPLVLELLRSAERDGTRAMKARSRKLLALHEKRAARPERFSDGAGRR